MNSKEIAILANVSRSTVSRVINKYKNVPEETRKKVQDVIDKYGYTPNASARVLVGKTNKIIGIFIGDINKNNSEPLFEATSPYNAELIVRIMESCKKRGYMVLVSTITKQQECNTLEQYLKTRMLFGEIFVGFPYGLKILEDIALKNHNVVLIDQLTSEDDKESKIKLVNCDNRKGAYEITKYLIECGHKKIAHIEGDHRLSSIERKYGYISALKDFGIKINKNLIKVGEYKKDIAYEKMKEILKTETPTAVFVANDMMALGVGEAVREAGLKIPEDISIIGFDNLRFWENLSEESNKLLFNLTTMEVDMREIAENAVASLFSEKKEHKYCMPKLIKKHSVLKK